MDGVCDGMQVDSGPCRDCHGAGHVKEPLQLPLHCVASGPEHLAGDLENIACAKVGASMSHSLPSLEFGWVSRFGYLEFGEVCMALARSTAGLKEFEKRIALRFEEAQPVSFVLWTADPLILMRVGKHIDNDQVLIERHSDWGIWHAVVDKRAPARPLVWIEALPGKRVLDWPLLCLGRRASPLN